MTKTEQKRANVAIRTEPVSEAEMDRYIAEHHDLIEAQLNEARAEIAEGKAAPLEPLPELLRDARRHARVKAR